MNDPMHIIFEGQDGSGKDYAASLYHDHLLKTTGRAISAREPFGHIGAIFSRIAVQFPSPQENNRAMFDFSEVQRQLCSDFVKSCLHDHKRNVVQVRSWLSAMIYHRSKDPIRDYRGYGIQPNLWVIMTPPVETIIKRLKSRSGESFDKKQDHTTLRHMYLDAARQLSDLGHGVLVLQELPDHEIIEAIDSAIADSGFGACVDPPF